MRYRLIIWYGIILHFFVGLGALLDKSSIGASNINATALLLGTHYAGWVFIFVAVSGLVGLYKLNGIMSLLFFIPLQFTMFASAVAAVQLAFAGHYADGTVRSFWFIANDQMPNFLTCIAYTFALIEHFTQGIREKETADHEC